MHARLRFCAWVAWQLPWLELELLHWLLLVPMALAVPRLRQLPWLELELLHWLLLERLTLLVTLQGRHPCAESKPSMQLQWPL